MDDDDERPMSEHAGTEFLALSYADEQLDSRPGQLSDQCTSMILDSENCQGVNAMAPLNDLLLGQTFIIETNEQPLFGNNTQLITFQHIDSNEEIHDIQTISIVGSEKQIIQNANFTDEHFQDIYSNFGKSNSDLIKTNNVCGDNLKEHLEVLTDTDTEVDITRGNYSNSTAIKILDDIAKSPIDSNGHFVCDLCLCEYYNWKHYKRHKLEHLNDKPFKCLKCSKSFNYNNNYLLHIASHLTNNLKCPQCKKEFKRIASFKCHLEIHKTEESITCNICYKIFDNQYRLDIHKEKCMQENIIDPDNPVEIASSACFKTCKICKKSLSTVSEYKMHIKEHRKFDSVLKKQYKFAMKSKKVHNKANIIKKFKCDHCHWSFNKSNLLRRHMRTHTGEKPFECSYCSRFFTQQNSLTRHLLKHKGLRPFKCEFCEMNFSQKGHLINHMKRCHAVTKEATRVHECTACSCVYNSLNALNKHLNVYHGLKTKKFNINVNVQNSKQKNVEPNETNETINLIKDSSKLEKWLEEVAQELQSGDNNSEKHCNNPMSDQCELKLNLIENEPFEMIEHNLSQISNIEGSDNVGIGNVTYSTQSRENCAVSKKKQDQSPVKYDNVTNLENTVAVSNNVNESMSLVTKDVCKKASSRKNDETASKLNSKTTLTKKKNLFLLNLKSSDGNPATSRTNRASDPKVLYLPNITTNIVDMNINVAQKSQTKCQFCEKVFKKNADLKRHERTHTGDKPYKCEKLSCNKAFATKSSLEYHLITHLGSMKRAACPECKGLFATTSSMKVHMRQHTGEKPFNCPICGDAFRTSGHLQAHSVMHERKKKCK